MRTAVLTISTSVSRREAEDESGPALAALAEEAGCEVVAMEVVPDDFALIEDRLRHYVEDERRVRLHDRRHGSDARRRDARGDARGDRARRARLRGGDAGRRALATRRSAILSAAVTGRRRAHADRQLPRLAEGGRASSSACWRPRWATPSRRCAGDVAAAWRTERRRDRARRPGAALRRAGRAAPG